MIERHAIAEPADLMLAQYSIPFCVALALFREARDPESYDESALAFFQETVEKRCKNNGFPSSGRQHRETSGNVARRGR